MEPVTDGMRYIARQPILDRFEHTVGYELLYRAAVENFARIGDADLASQSTLDTSLLIGLQPLAGAHRLYINCGRDLLKKEYATLLPANRVVLEILETVEPHAEVLSACRRLRNAGYSIALDDFVPTEKSLPFLEVADSIKVDFRATPERACAQIGKEYGGRFQLVAEKIETRREYSRAREMGYDLFQGHYFCEPTLLSTREITPLKLNHIRLLQAACSPDLDLQDIEKTVKSDAALCYRLLHYMNSAAFFLQSSITSIRHALALMGERETRKWIAITAVSLAQEEKPAELLVTALARARFCELLSTKARCKPYDSFVVGLFSLMDAILDMPLPAVLSRVEIPPEPRAALLGKPVRLRQLHDLMLSWDSAGWSDCSRYCNDLGLSEEQTSIAYLESVQWVNSIVAPN